MIMKQNQSIPGLLINRQWNIACVVILAVMAIIAWRLLLPLGKDVFNDGKKLTHSISLVSKADSIAYLANAMQNNADRLDSLIRTISDTQTLSEQTIPGTLYNLAGNSGIKTSKLEISKPVKVPEGLQIPVTMAAEGNYGQCGKFIDGLENMEFSVRIRDLDMKNAAKGQVTMFLDFIILSQKQL